MGIEEGKANELMEYMWKLIDSQEDGITNRVRMNLLRGLYSKSKELDLNITIVNGEDF